MGGEEIWVKAFFTTQKFYETVENQFNGDFLEILAMDYGHM